MGADPFGDAVKKLDISADTLLKAAENLKRLTEGQWGTPAPQVKEPTDRTPKSKPDIPGPQVVARPPLTTNPFERFSSYNRQGEPDEGTNRRSYEEQKQKNPKLGEYAKDVDYTRPVAPGKGGKAAGLTEGMGFGRAAGKALGAVGLAIGFAQTMNDSRKRIEEWTAAVLASRQKLAESSGAMAGVFARRDVQEMLRDRSKGDQLAGTTQRLSDSEQRRKDAMAPIEVAIGNASNRVLSELNNLLVPFLSGVNGAIEWAKENVPNFKKFIGGDPPGAGDLFTAIAAPGGLLEQANKLEQEAKDKLAAAKNIGKKFGLPKGKLP